MPPQLISYMTTSEIKAAAKAIGREMTKARKQYKSVLYSGHTTYAWQAEVRLLDLRLHLRKLQNAYQRRMAYSQKARN